MLGHGTNNGAMPVRICNDQVAVCKGGNILRAGFYLSTWICSRPYRMFHVNET